MRSEFHSRFNYDQRSRFVYYFTVDWIEIMLKVNSEKMRKSRRIRLVGNVIGAPWIKDVNAKPYTKIPRFFPNKI